MPFALHGHHDRQARRDRGPVDLPYSHPAVVQPPREPARVLRVADEHADVAGTTSSASQPRTVPAATSSSSVSDQTSTTRRTP